MKLTAKQTEQMLKAAKPLIKWMGKNCDYQSHRIVVSAVGVELKESIAEATINGYFSRAK